MFCIILCSHRVWNLSPNLNPSPAVEISHKMSSQIFAEGFGLCLDQRENALVTRMHSSRMRTGRSLTVCCSLLPGGCLLPGGGCLLRGVSALGGSAPGGVSQHALRQTPPPLWTEFLTHACENITLAQLRCGR